jgi:hypothetical protein
MGSFYRDWTALGCFLNLLFMPIAVAIHFGFPEAAYYGDRLGAAASAVFVLTMVAELFVVFRASAQPSRAQKQVILKLYLWIAWGTVPLIWLTSDTIVGLVRLLHLATLIEAFFSYSTNVQATVIFVGGILLFVFRLYARVAYGLTEVTVGVIVGIHRLGAWPNPSVRNLIHADALGVLCAGVYLVVRGLDNAHQGLRRDTKDIVVSTIRKRIGRLGGGQLAAGTPQSADNPRALAPGEPPGR